MRDWARHLDHLASTDMLRSLRTLSGPQGAQVVLDGQQVLMLCSNNYLGLANHPALIEAACRATVDYGVGSSGSRLLSGSMTLHAAFEQRLAAFKGTPAALLFNSGYAANTGILSGLFTADDVIFSDALNHASIIDGCRLSAAKTIVYPHADVAALAALMEHERPRRRGRWLIVTDGVFSMDGDMAPLADLCALKDANDALLMVDDAHGTGVLGATGRGSGEVCGCLECIDLHMGTLGKGLGGFGAYLAGPQTVIDTLVNLSRPFIFSTSLPPAVPAAAIAALDIVDSSEGEQLRRQLARNQQLFVATLQAGGAELTATTTQIVPILTRTPGRTLQAAKQLLTDGILLQGVRPPTVPEGGCRLRATLMATHSREQLTLAALKILSRLHELPSC
jgi:glycine C-acetyltransferase/8-amino-7-oxononanoate synthase